MTAAAVAALVRKLAETRLARAQAELAEAEAEAHVLGALAEHLQGRSAPSRYADFASNPYGSPRAYLDAARRGEFKSFRRAKRVTALWSDVEAAIERRARTRKHEPDGLSEQDRADLEAGGAIPRSAANDAGRRRSGGRR